MTVLIVAVGGPTGVREANTPIGDAADNTRLLGETLFSKQVFSVELTALLLTVAVIGAVVLSARPQKPLIRTLQESDTEEETEEGGNDCNHNLVFVVSCCSFSIGTVGLLVRRNPLIMFMCIELMLNAVTITFVSIGSHLNDLGGQLAVFFVLVVAAAEVVVGLALVVAIMRRRARTNADDLKILGG